MKSDSLLQDSDAVRWVHSLVDDDLSPPDELLARSVKTASDLSPFARDQYNVFELLSDS